jgi:hypothetical protein
MAERLSSSFAGPVNRTPAGRSTFEETTDPQNRAVNPEELRDPTS